jgi:hypothetical protein
MFLTKDNMQAVGNCSNYSQKLGYGEATSKGGIVQELSFGDTLLKHHFKWFD